MIHLLNNESDWLCILFEAEEQDILFGLWQYLVCKTRGLAGQSTKRETRLWAHPLSTQHGWPRASVSRLNLDYMHCWCTSNLFLNAKRIPKKTQFLKTFHHKNCDKIFFYDILRSLCLKNDAGFVYRCVWGGRLFGRSINYSQTSVLKHLEYWHFSNTDTLIVGLLSIYSLYCVIVRVSVVLKRTVVGDWRFDNLSGSHLQSQVNSVCQSMSVECCWTT